MAIDLDALSAVEENYKYYSKIASLVFDDLGGIEVACLRYHKEDYDEYFIQTDADFCYEEDESGNVGRIWDNTTPLYRSCEEARKRAREIWFHDFREKNMEKWMGMSSKEIVMDIVERVWQGEWLGQAYKKVVYAQDVARLLDFPNPDSFGNDNPIWDVLLELRAEEKIDLDGAILHRYSPGFRFPDEIRSLIRYVYEEPLGWPNGDAGDGALSEIEHAISRNTHFSHGKTLVGEDNFPSLADRHLVTFGLAWLHKGATRMLKEQNSAEREYLLEVAESLEELSRQIKESALHL